MPYVTAEKKNVVSLRIELTFSADHKSPSLVSIHETDQPNDFNDDYLVLKRWSHLSQNICSGKWRVADPAAAENDSEKGSFFH